MTYLVAQMLRPYKYIRKYEMHPAAEGLLTDNPNFYPLYQNKNCKSARASRARSEQAIAQETWFGVTIFASLATYRVHNSPDLVHTDRIHRLYPTTKTWRSGLVPPVPGWQL